ncbi:hypothetical protein, partial [Bacteroides xylanisolvens]|uniref:hypothetical protein n=1 Tax=Bacteroides xylanisolvens TaxID=371601 RepID=UPI0034A3B72D
LKIQKRQLTRNELVALNFIILGISLYHLNLKMLDLSFYLGFSCLPFAIWLQVHYLTANLTIFQFKMCIFAR